MASAAAPNRPPIAAWREAFAEGRRVLPAIFLIAILLRLALILFLPQQPMSDGEWYMARAAEIASGMGYQQDGHPTAFWPVGYPALIAGTMLVFGKGMLGPLLLNLASAIAILWLVLWFGRRVAASELAARLAALLYAIYPAHIAYTGASLSETSYTAVAMAAFALLVARPKDWRFLALSGLLFGLATLMRPQTMLFPIGALIALVLVFRAFRWTDAAKALLILAVAGSAVVLPWTLRNRSVFGETVLVSTNGGVALYTGASDRATGDHFTWEDPSLWREIGFPMAERNARQVELDRHLKELSWAWIAEHPGRWLALGPKKVLILWTKDSDAFWSLKASHPALELPLTAAQALNQLFYLAILALAAFCAFVATRALVRREEPTMPLGLLFCMPLFVSLLAFGFTGQIRYHYPAMPFLIVAAGWTLAQLLRRQRTT